ncbi:hypothetical protein P3T76_007668 [Phytophthora citrophthora]|uniref:Uncharacterized protein n=1 Tax=Phytophthora citrophthora TaxID=4793 RepID=A0AAD9GM46_9STRA|nr:hypothetical protein P3T76_007668 [Phytophthora citrophthora]
MNAASALSSLYLSASSLCSLEEDKQQQPMSEPSPVSKPKQNSTVTILPAPSINVTESASISATSSYPFEAVESPTSLDNEGYRVKLDENETQAPMISKGKRKRLNMDDELTSFLSPTPTTRKAGSNDFLRKGQWTSTEERLARLLIETFEDGYLPIYTGIRLRGYLAVQLQCDPMRVSKKLCAGTIDGKPVPRNYGQKKFKLRKKSLWDSEEASYRIAELEKVTKAMWTEARMRKPSYLTLSSTRTLSKLHGSGGEDESKLSPSSPARGRTPSTPKHKKQKVFPIIYLNLSKFKRNWGKGDSSNSDPASPCFNSDSDGEPVRLDGESLQAAYDLLTLCSPRGSSSKSKSRQGRSKKTIVKKAVAADGNKVNTIKDKSDETKFNVTSQDRSSTQINEELPTKDEDIITMDKSIEEKSSPDTSADPIENADIPMEDVHAMEISEVNSIFTTREPSLSTSSA